MVNSFSAAFPCSASSSSEGLLSAAVAVTSEAALAVALGVNGGPAGAGDGKPW
jgi:hypothetical protein